MREAARDLDRLLHIKEAIGRVQTYMQDKSFDDLSEDSMLFFAVVKNIEIVGEAAYKLTHEFCEAHPATPWQDIIDMRHVLVHGYYTTSRGYIWATVQSDLPVLLAQVTDYIAELSATQN